MNTTSTPADTPLTLPHAPALADPDDMVRPTPEQVEAWLAWATGAAIPGVTTASIMALSRGDD